MCRQRPGQVDCREKIAAVPFQRPTSPTWVHDLAVSERYAVVVQNPVQVGPRLLCSRCGWWWRWRRPSWAVVSMGGGGAVPGWHAKGLCQTTSAMWWWVVVQVVEACVLVVSHRHNHASGRNMIVRLHPWGRIRCRWG